MNALEQMRVDQALGAAFRRCVALDPETELRVHRGRYYAEGRYVATDQCDTAQEALEQLEQALLLTQEEENAG